MSQQIHQNNKQSTKKLNLNHSRQHFKKKHRNQYLSFSKQLVNIYGSTQIKLKQSQQRKSPELSNTNQQPYKPKQNPFAALSQLKSAQQQFQMIKKRLQVLKLKDQKNTHKVQLNQKKLKFHNSVQQIISIQKQKINQWKQLSQQKVDQQKIINLHQKINRQKNLQSMHQLIQENKQKQYEQRKNQANNNLKLIHQYSEEHLNSNKQKVQKIKNLQNYAKNSVEAFTKSRILSFKDKKLQQTDHLLTKKSQKQLQIKKLLELQMQMIEKQSRSRIILDKSVQKVRQILNPLNPQTRKSNKSLNKSRNLNGSVIQSSDRDSKLKNHEQNIKQNQKNNAIENKINFSLQLKNKIQEVQTNRNSQFLTEGAISQRQLKSKGFSLPQIYANKKKY